VAHVVKAVSNKDLLERPCLAFGPRLAAAKRFATGRSTTRYTSPAELGTSASLGGEGEEVGSARMARSFGAGFVEIAKERTTLWHQV
jgi:hypothetical protein